VAPAAPPETIDPMAYLIYSVLGLKLQNKSL